MNTKKDRIERRLQVEGMHCIGCADAVERSLMSVRGVKKASVDILTRQANVIGDESVRDEDLVAAVENAGYAASVAE